MVKGDFGKKKEIKKAAISYKKEDPKQPKKKPKRKPKRPKRQKPNKRMVKSGPKFAMDLAVASNSGTTVSMDLVNKARGSGGEFSSGDVDEEPSCPQANSSFEAPDKVIEQEIDANVVISFCVNKYGKPYNLKITDEEPKGLGMGQAAINSISSIDCQAAQYESSGVDYCTVTIPFNVTFRD